MPTYSNCEMYVTRDSIRVFGTDGEIHGCPQCTTYCELCDGCGVENPTES